MSVQFGSALKFVLLMTFKVSIYHMDFEDFSTLVLFVTSCDLRSPNQIQFILRRKTSYALRKGLKCLAPQGSLMMVISSQSGVSERVIHGVMCVNQ